MTLGTTFGGYTYYVNSSFNNDDWWCYLLQLASQPAPLPQDPLEILTLFLYSESLIWVVRTHTDSEWDMIGDTFGVSRGWELGLLRRGQAVISNYYLLGHKLMSLSIIGPIFPILLPFQHYGIRNTPHRQSASVSTFIITLKSIAEVFPSKFKISLGFLFFIKWNSS